MDVHSGTGTYVLDIPDDASNDSISGPTDKEDESDAEMAAQTNNDDDDNDDNNDHGDGPSPSHELPIIAISDIPCDPPVTQEEDIRLAEGGLVENVEVSLSEGGGKENGESETGDKNQD